MKIIDLIVGTRPNFMKVAPIIKAIDELGAKRRLDYRLIHTGQHYDNLMSGQFFDQLEIPVPNVNLGIKIGTQISQVAEILCRYEAILSEKPCDICLVVGDVTSTMAAAITAQKMQIKVGHIEAGLRSGDWKMPEEINRLITDSISNYFFTTSEEANQNLHREGVGAERVFFVGNTMIDTLLSNREKFKQPDFWNDCALSEGGYVLLTLHRPQNVDCFDSLKAILQKVADSAQGNPIIFPIHPRTRKKLDGCDSLFSEIVFVDPLPYLEFGFLSKNARVIITDSGGITEEATVNRTPCITLRNSTERPETVALGTNEVIGHDFERLQQLVYEAFQGKWKTSCIPALWDGGAGKRIVRLLGQLI